MTSKLQMPIPKRFFKMKMSLAASRIRRKLRSMTNEDILNLPECSDDIVNTKMRFLERTFELFFFYRKDLLSFICVSMIELTLAHGKNTFTALSLVNFGFYLCKDLHEHDEAMRLGLLALKMIETYPQGFPDRRSLDLFCHFVSHWRVPFVAIVMNWP